MKRFVQKLFSNKKVTTIQFCEKNLDRYLDEKMTIAFKEFLQHPQIQYKEYECLSHCDSCKKAAYAMVNGRYIEAEHMKDLLEKLKSEIQ